MLGRIQGYGSPSFKKLIEPQHLVYTLKLFDRGLRRNAQRGVIRNYGPIPFQIAESAAVYIGAIVHWIMYDR